MVDETKQQDLDMLYVLRKIKQSVKRFFGGIGWLISFSVQNFFKLSVFVLIIVGLGIGLYYMKRSYFASTLTVGHTRVDNDYCKQLIENLGEFIDGKDNVLLAGALGVSIDNARQVRDIEYFPLNENLARRFADSSHVLLPFKITVEVYETRVLDSLQVGLLKYLENNDFAQRRKALDLELLLSAQSRVIAEIGAIDSLKEIVNESIIPRGLGNGIVYGEPLNPVDVYRRSMELFEQRQMLSKRMTLINSFEAIVSFNKSAKRADTGIVMYVLISLCVGYLIGLFWLIPRQNAGAA